MGPTCYTVTRIDGDYAVMVSVEGIENTVAMALLPPVSDEGVRLVWENFTYRALA